MNCFRLFSSMRVAISENVPLVASLLFIFVCFTASCAPNDSLRIGTYNLQYWPPGGIPGGTRDWCCDNIPDRAGKLAERIIASDYDIIALNEVWDDEAKNRLIEALRETHPYYVKEARNHAAGYQDAGLMLFSKWPFLPLPNVPPFRLVTRRGINHYFVPSANISYRGADEDADDVDRALYLWYVSCDMPDCLADKGVVYVRIQNPSSRRIYNIFFTHLQAGGDSVKEAQLGELEWFARAVLTEEQLRTEAVFVLGDMNINGDWAAEDRTLWERTFGPSSSRPFYVLRVHDTWHWDIYAEDIPQGKRDRGLTTWFGKGVDLGEPGPDGGFAEAEASRGGERLDYILYNNVSTGSSPPEPELCLQHLTVAYNLRHGEPIEEGGMYRMGQQDLSDHYGLNADINAWAEHCSPQEARVVQQSDFDERGNVLFDGTISKPGSVQWYVVHGLERATYSIAVLGKDDLRDEDVDFRIYTADEMSIPYQGLGYRGETTPFVYEERVTPPGDTAPGAPSVDVHRVEGRTYGYLPPPFYIKVYAATEEGLPSRAKVGGYQLIVHRHQGSSQEDADILPPNVQLVSRGTPRSGVTLGSLDRWFRIDTEGPNSGRAQQLRFLASTVLDPGAYRMQLIRDDEVLSEVAGGGVQVIERASRDDNRQTFYLKVTPAADTQPLVVAWYTNLTVVSAWGKDGMMVKAEYQVNRPDAGRDDWNVDFSAEVSRKEFLFTIAPGFQEELVQGIISPELREAFLANGRALLPVTYVADLPYFAPFRVPEFEADDGSFELVEAVCPEDFLGPCELGRRHLIAREGEALNVYGLLPREPLIAPIRLGDFDEGNSVNVWDLVGPIRFLSDEYIELDLSIDRRAGDRRHVRGSLGNTAAFFASLKDDWGTLPSAGPWYHEERLLMVTDRGFLRDRGIEEGRYLFSFTVSAGLQPQTSP